MPLNVKMKTAEWYGTNVYKDWEVKTGTTHVTIDVWGVFEGHINT